MISTCGSIQECTYLTTSVVALNQRKESIKQCQDVSSQSKSYVIGLVYMFWALLRAHNHSNPRLAARTKMSLS